MNEKYVRYLKRIRFSVENRISVLLNKKSHSERESVLFFTVHKAASSLFSGCILKCDNALIHVDYARKIYRGRSDAKISLEKYGYIYGPLRVSADRESVVYNRLVKPLVNEIYLNDKTSLVVVRDPRDVLVSSFYSFGYSHNISPNQSIAKKEIELRNAIQNMTIDEYVIKNSSQTKIVYQDIISIKKWSRKCKILFYEDLVDRWAEFKSDISEVLTISGRHWEYIENQTRPRRDENIQSHRRSGKTQSYLSKLKPETVEELNERLNTELVYFGYIEE